MVLDPLSTFSVACNVLQVVEIGVRVLSKAADYRKAESGVLNEQKDLRDVVQSLNSLNTELADSLARQAGPIQHSAEETCLIEANNQCLRLSKEFVEFLDRLKVRDRHAVLDSLRMSIKTLWHADKVNAMEKSLSQARDNLNVAFLVFMNSKQATQSSQREILRSTTRIEGSILSAVRSTSDSIQDDIKILTEQLGRVALDTAQQSVTQFSASHSDKLAQLSRQLDLIFDLQTDWRAFSDDTKVATARQRVFDSLQFPRMLERHDQISVAHEKTYQWILRSNQDDTTRQHGFVEWIRAPFSAHHIYWIHGKIGAGKSTLMRFLLDNIDTQKHMLPWAQQTVVRASFFFWNAGNEMQKSISGLLKTLVTQLFEQTPNLIPRVVQLRKWQVSLLPGHHSIEWTESELRDCLREYILHATKSSTILLLIDGLDELEGRQEARETLVDLLIELAEHQNVKICVSSRPWNIFLDAFEGYPQLKLEDLTYGDISAYVRGQLHQNKLFLGLVKHDHYGAERLVTSLIDKAAGVFLWVRLVVKQLLIGLRDGDGILALNNKIEEIPADLDDYFMRLINSIEPHNRREASKLFQLALYNEYEFTSLHTHYLVDFSFVEEDAPDFALRHKTQSPALDFSHPDAMKFRLESTIRKVNGRCMGLLECHPASDLAFDSTFRFTPHSFIENEEMSVTNHTGAFFETDLDIPRHSIELLDDSSMYGMAYMVVDSIHRSLRDFLLTPKIQSLLHQYTHGPYDVRMFYRSARLTQLLAFNTWENPVLSIATGLASYVLSTLTVNNFRDAPDASAFAALIKPAIENMAQFEDLYNDQMWYLSCILQSWHEESSTFMTLAIDFGLDAYIRTHLDPQSIQDKKGRPILDYVLRPRFIFLEQTACIGNDSPDPLLLNFILQYGADPNQKYQNASVWALFLCFLSDIVSGLILGPVSQLSTDMISSYFEIVSIMLQHGADTILSENWLSHDAYYNSYGIEYVGDESPDQRFRRRFPTLLPVSQGTTPADTFYAVNGILEQLLWHCK